MGKATILLVEGKSAGTSSWSAALRKEDMEVREAHTGRSALKDATAHPPDLIIFDGASMRSSGIRSCRRLRRQFADVPIIHIRPEGALEDRSAEADIYLMAPFTPRKLLNRVRALLPADASEEQIVRAGHITLFCGKRSVDIDGRGERRLTPKLCRLLEELLRHPNQIVTRVQLMENVWHTTYVGDTRTLDVHIRWVREMIEQDPSRPRLLRTARGQGYVYRPLPPPEEVEEEA